MAKYDYKIEKEKFIKEVTPFLQGLIDAWKEENGEIYFRECTLNGEDYDPWENSETNDLDVLFVVIWEEYFLNGDAEFNDDSEFTFDAYKDFDYGTEYIDCYFSYKKDKITCYWHEDYDNYIKYPEC